MPQFQASVPDPLTDDLPDLLSGRRMATPAIRVDLLVFIGKQRGTRATMGGASATTSEAVNPSCGRRVQKSS